MQSYCIFCGTNFKNWSIVLKQKEKTFHFISKSREYAIGDTSCFNIWDTAYRRGWQNCDINGMDIIREGNTLFSLIVNSGLDWVVSWFIALRKTNLWGLWFVIPSNFLWVNEYGSQSVTLIAIKHPNNKTILSNFVGSSSCYAVV